MKTLIFDTETTGFVTKSARLTAPQQPYLVQIAALLTQDDEILEDWSTIVSCPINIPPGASAVHGITTERSQAEGIHNNDAIRLFHGLIEKADRAVCHNATFDSDIMRIAYARAGLVMDWTRIRLAETSSIPLFCTMKSISDDARRKGRPARWPKLAVAYSKFVDSAGFAGAHSADADTMACWQVLRALEKQNIVLSRVAY